MYTVKTGQDLELITHDHSLFQPARYITGSTNKPVLPNSRYVLNQLLTLAVIRYSCALYWKENETTSARPATARN